MERFIERKLVFKIYLKFIERSDYTNTIEKKKLVSSS